MFMCATTERNIIYLFVGGILIAQINLMIADLDRWRPRAFNLRDWYSIVPIIFCIIGMHFGGGPLANYGSSPGYRTMFRMIPESWNTKETWSMFWPCIGAMLVVGSISVSTTMQRPFTTHFAQYLGELSFSLYLVHWTIIETFCKTFIIKVVLAVGGAEGYWRWVFGMTLNVCWIAALTFWVADIFARYVDNGSVNLAKKIEVYLQVPPEELPRN